MVECNLAKVEVAGSNPVSRSIDDSGWFQNHPFFCGLRTTCAYISKGWNESARFLFSYYRLQAGITQW